MTALLLRVSRIENWFSNELVVSEPVDVLLTLSGMGQYNPDDWEPVFMRISQRVSSIGAAETVVPAISR